MKQHLRYNRINRHVRRNILHRDLLSILNLLNVDDVTFYSRQTITILFLYIYHEHTLRNIHTN